jgi:hypothetical protein
MEIFLIIIGSFLIGTGFSFLFNFIVNKKVNKIRENLNDEISENFKFLEEFVNSELEDLKEDLKYTESQLEHLERTIDIMNSEIIELYDDQDEEDLIRIIEEKVNERKKDNLDEVLDKISKEGYNSLDEEQKIFLKEYKKNNRG